MGPPQRRATRRCARKKRWSILSRLARPRGPTALQPGSSMKESASTRAAARSSSGASGLTSGTEGQAPRALAEPQLDKEGPDGRADHRLAVAALDAQAGQAPATYLLGHRLERLAEPVLVGVPQRQQP